jgi:predicted alpha/beta superfamily hydrolase
MTKRQVLAVGTAGLLAAAAAAALYRSGDEPLGKDVVASTLRSTVLGEERRLLVFLPESYAGNTDRRYPVIYVLDGPSQATHTARSAAALARSRAMPEVIVVGLPNTSGPNRERDLTPPFLRRDVDDPASPLGAGDRFLAFLKDEVLPRIEREYRTTPFRVLAGNSRGGLLVVYSLIAAPGLFDARFAFSTPLWRQDEITVARLREALAARADLSSFLYLGVGGEETERIQRGYHSAVAVLREHAPQGLRWQAEITPGADHQDNAERSTPSALKALYLAGEWPTSPPSSTVPPGRKSRPGS